VAAAAVAAAAAAAAAAAVALPSWLLELWVVLATASDSGRLAVRNLSPLELFARSFRGLDDDEL
jgi:hypothetical protein